MNNPLKESNYKWYVLGVLTVVYTFSFIDRQILVILAEPIKAELGLSDTQLGVLTGLAFAALYVVLGIPVARLADLSNRKNVVVVSLAIWSFMTTLSGSVTSYLQLLLTRFGVGIGEAGGSPPAHSIISDYFPPKQRATALSIYSTGIYIGILLGYVIGGYIAKYYGWRMAFYVLGIPGVLFAVFLYFTVKEPIKGQSDDHQLSDSNPSLGEVIGTLFKSKTFVFAALASGFHAFGLYGVGNFLPSFLQRVHHVDIATAGFVLGLTTGIGGGIGTFLGGYLADKFQVRDRRWYLWIPIIAGLVSLIPHTILVFTADAKMAMVMTFFTGSITAFYMGPLLAVTHSLVNAKMRAFASAILFFVLNLIGLGLGPLVIGYISDILTPTYGDLSLKWAFCSIYVSASIALIFFWLASRYYVQDLSMAKSRALN